MGHSDTDFCDKRFLSHDHKIQAWVQFLSDVIEGSNDASEKLASIAAEWLDHFDWAGNGCIDLELDRHFKDDSTLRQEFNAYIDRTQAHIASFAPSISSEYLIKQHGLDDRSGYRSDLPVENLLSYGSALSSIVNGRTPERDVA